MSVEQLKEQIKFEQFVNSFYLDLLVNHAIYSDGYYSFVLKLISDLKNSSKDPHTLNSELKNIPGVMFQKIQNGEIDFEEKK